MKKWLIGWALAVAVCAWVAVFFPWPIKEIVGVLPCVVVCYQPARKAWLKWLAALGSAFFVLALMGDSQEITNHGPYLVSAWIGYLFAIVFQSAWFSTLLGSMREERVGISADESKR